GRRRHCRRTAGTQWWPRAVGASLTGRAGATLARIALATGPGPGCGWRLQSCRRSLPGGGDQPAAGGGWDRCQRAAGLRAVAGGCLSATDGASPHPALPRKRRRGKAVIASLRAESVKTRKRWANWILFGILLLTLLLLGYV